MTPTWIAIAALEVAMSGSQYTIIDHTEAERRARACGFTAVTMDYVEEEQTDYLVIADPTASNEQIACLAAAFDATFFQVVVPEVYAQAYYSSADELAAPRNRALAREELSRLGYGEPPPYDPATMSDADFALVLERFCGPAATGALGSDWGPRTISPEFLRRELSAPPAAPPASYCLLLASQLSGFTIGFIGNGKLPDEDKPIL